MTWTAYEVILRLCAPLHIGWRKVGNLQMTRPYVTGRNLWGALTMRLARDQAQGPDTDPSQYWHIGRQVHVQLAFTYFYPALKSKEGYKVYWPWENEMDFRYRFLASYASAALAPERRTAEEGLLHEVEFISPYTRDTGEPVYLLGYVFERQGTTLPWQDVVQHLQLGGERSYGWGMVMVEKIKLLKDNTLFHEYPFNGNNERPIITLKQGQRLLAHTRADTLSGYVQGGLEPLMGREWGVSPGDRLSKVEVCFVPGAQVQNDDFRFMVRAYGLWEVTP